MSARRHLLRSLTLSVALLASARADELAVPRSGADPKAFVPAGWKLEGSIEGDLDGDQKPDAVAVLLQEDKGQEERKRALVILLRRDAGYVPGGTNVGLLACFQCAGVNGGDAAPELEIKKGVLLVAQTGGSREEYSTLHRVRWNKQRGRFELIGVDFSTEDRITGEGRSSSRNLLTGDVVEVRTPATTDEDGNPKKPTPKPTTVRKNVGKKPPPTLEEVKQ